MILDHLVGVDSPKLTPPPLLSGRGDLGIAPLPAGRPWLCRVIAVRPVLLGLEVGVVIMGDVKVTILERVGGEGRFAPDVVLYEGGMAVFAKSERGRTAPRRRLDHGWWRRVVFW